MMLAGSSSGERLSAGTYRRTRMTGANARGVVSISPIICICRQRGRCGERKKVPKMQPIAGLKFNTMSVETAFYPS
jgi:hypothetical protein